ncbi:MAG: PAS domain-containing protein [Chloroflexota bacterium]|nr:MAG: PAS domain-containing protein [Chloroflexota bacterium]
MLKFLLDLSAADAWVDETQAWFLKETKKLLAAEAVSLFLCEKAFPCEITRKSWKDGGQWSCQPLREEESREVLEVIKSGKPWVSPNNRETRTFLFPLAAYQEKIGALAIEADHQQFDPDLLGAICAVLAVNIVRSRQAQQAKDTIRAMQTFQEQLLNSRNTLRALFDSSPSAIYIIDPHYQLKAINMTRADLAEKTPPEMVGKKCFAALYQRESPCPGCLVVETLQTGSTTRRLEKRISAGQNGADIEISTFPIWDSDQNIVQAFLFEEDITEQQQLQASLAQSEKLAAVGQLAAGVAHEINNPLTTILGNAQLLKRSLPVQNKDSLEMVDLIIEACDRASQSVRNLLDFSRRERYELAPTDVNETIQRTLALIGHELGSRSISLQFEPAMDLPPVNASQDRLQGVWLNLLLNALDAVDRPQGLVSIKTRRDGNTIEVVVSDNGQGIPADKISRIFEPFYTTKDPGVGTGLGLTVCHQVITRHGGKILASSQEGQGATFTVILPIS